MLNFSYLYPIAARALALGPCLPCSSMMLTQINLHQLMEQGIYA